jgi:hypothetical protein
VTSFQTGLVQRYALVAVLGVIVFILVFYNGLLTSNFWAKYLTVF